MNAANAQLAATVQEVALLHNEEGCVLKAYQDRAKVWTIGWGHTGPEVYDGLVWTQAQADAQFAADLEQRGSAPVRASVAVPLTPGQFDALSSLVFNIGGGNFQGSTLLKRLNTSDWYGAGQEFAVWNHSGGTVDPVLVKRRARELWLFARSSP